MTSVGVKRSHQLHKKEETGNKKEPVSLEDKIKKINSLLLGFTSKSDISEITNIILKTNPEEIILLLKGIDISKLNEDLDGKTDFIIKKLESNSGKEKTAINQYINLFSNLTGISEVKVQTFFRGSELNNKTNLESYLKEHEAEPLNAAFVEKGPRADLIGTINNSKLSGSEKTLAKSVLENVNDGNIDKFKKLLDNGTLAKKDSKGSTILENLNKIVTKKRASSLKDNNISDKDILNQVIKNIENPLSVKQGSNKGTCGACTMEYVLLRGNPAEFTRITEQLTSEAKSVKLKDGSKLTLPENSIPSDSSGRSSIDRMFQSSLMNQANLMGLDYDNPSDDGGFIAVLGGNSAITVGAFKELYQSITGVEMDDPSSYTFGEEDIGARMQNALAKKEDVPVMLSFGDTFAYHWLAAEKINYGKDGEPESIVLRNPWGYDSGGGEPPRTSLGKGRIKMRWVDFVNRLNGAVIPKDLSHKSIDKKNMPVQARVSATEELMDGYTNTEEESTIKELLIGSSGKDLSDIIDKLSVSDIVSELEEDGDLAKVMIHIAKNYSSGNNSKHLSNFMKHTDDDISRKFIKGLTTSELTKVGNTKDGRSALKKARSNLDDGWTTDNEYSQMKKLDNVLKKTMPVNEKASRIKSLISGITSETDEDTIRDILLSTSGSKLSQLLSKIDIGDLYSELDQGDLTKVMKHIALNSKSGNNAYHFSKLVSKVDDDTTMAFLKRMTDNELEDLASTSNGKSALNKAWNNLDSGWTGDSEYSQMKRIKNIIR